MLTYYQLNVRKSDGERKRHTAGLATFLINFLFLDLILKRVASSSSVRAQTETSFFSPTNRGVFLFFDFRILQNLLLFVFYTSGGLSLVSLGRIVESKSHNLVHPRSRSPQIHFFFGQERDGGNTHAFSLPILNGQRLEVCLFLSPSLFLTFSW